jgi:diphosphomevalonate decarboxylase
MESKGIQPNTECRGRLVVESANGFPSDCGLASSASSFAALTIAIAKLLGLTSEYLDTEENLFWLASLSREGSGSSCRSFFQPWAIWGPDGAKGVPGLPRAESIQHIALIVDDQKKLVSSSEAHVRVATSELFVGRIARAESRLRELLELLSEHGGNPSVAAWNRACEISWIEFWDMHVLFETSRPPFGYFSSPTMLVLEWLRNYQIQVGPSRRHPMVTMDAGPNIHLLIWKDEALQDDLLHDLKKFLNASGAATVIDSEGFR